MSWFAPSDHKNDMMREAERLKTQTDRLSKELATRKNSIEQAQVAREKFESLEGDISLTQDQLLRLQHRNEVLEKQIARDQKANTALREDINLLRSEKEQAERLSVGVENSLATLRAQSEGIVTETKRVDVRLGELSVELGAVDDVSSTIGEMRQQTQQLKIELDALLATQSALVEEANVIQDSLLEEEGVHEAIIASLAEQQEVLRDLRKRSALAAKATSVTAFFKEASELTQLLGTRGMGNGARGRTNRTGPRAAISDRRTSVSSSSPVSATPPRHNTSASHLDPMVQSPPPPSTAAETGSRPLASGKTTGSSMAPQRAKTIASVMTQLQRLNEEEMGLANDINYIEQ